MASWAAWPPDDVHFGARYNLSTNPGFDPHIHLHTPAQHHQQGTGLHFPMSNASQNPFEVPQFFTSGANANLERSIHNQNIPFTAINMPGWISITHPLPQSGENVVRLKRETHFALEIVLEHLPNQPPRGCHGIKIPATSSVKRCSDTTGRTLLAFRVDLYGASTNQRYQAVCPGCAKREGKKKGTPSMINFKAEDDVIEPKEGKIRITFVLCCYPEDHQQGDTDFL